VRRVESAIVARLRRTPRRHGVGHERQERIAGNTSR
jgi:hypothetical protein